MTKKALVALAKNLLALSKGNDRDIYEFATLDRFNTPIIVRYILWENIKNVPIDVRTQKPYKKKK